MLIYVRHAAVLCALWAVACGKSVPAPPADTVRIDITHDGPRLDVTVTRGAEELDAWTAPAIDAEVGARVARAMARPSREATRNVMFCLGDSQIDTGAELESIMDALPEGLQYARCLPGGCPNSCPNHFQ